MDAMTDLQQVLSNVNKSDLLEPTVSAQPVRELKSMELSLVGGGTGMSHFF